MQISVIGAGAWGTALAQVLARNEHDVSLYTHEPEHQAALKQDRENKQYLPGMPFHEKLSVCEDLEGDVAKSDIILVAVPSHAFRPVLEMLKPHLNGQGVIWATKGLDPRSGEFLSDVAVEILGDSTNLAILSGPSFAKEVAQGQPTAVVVAGNDESFVLEMQKLFQAPHFRTYVCHDFLGAQVGGAVKNIMAIAVGVADGLGMGANTRAALMTRALTEMTRLGESLGAKRDTLMGLSGVGDLILTCSDNLSRNRRFGLYIGEGMDFEAASKKVEQVVEGFGNTQIVYDLIQRNGVSMPIVTQMYRVLYQGCSAKDAVEALLSREAGSE